MRTFFESDDNQVNLIEANDIESGKIASNNYVKLPDGTLICYGWEKHDKVTINQAWGNLRYCYLEPIMKRYPVPFIDSPTVTFTSGSTSVLSVTHKIYYRDKLPSVMLVSAADSVVEEVYIYYTAIGKWK